MLLGLVVAIFLILLVLGVAAPRVARALRREKEVESTHRAEQYVRAIQVYYRKFGHYPGSVEQLEKSNNQRFLRQKYLDPLTGKADWKLIQVGQAKTTVKGFFGQPLAGLPTAGLGSAAGMASPGGTGTAAGAAGSSFGSGSSSSFGPGSSAGSPGGAAGGLGLGSGGIGGGGGGTGTSTMGGSAMGGSAMGGSTVTGGGTGTSTSSGSGGIGSQSATSFTGGGAPFLGVGSAASGEAIVVVNEQTTYPTWEFLYDPRVEQMKAKVSLFGGGPASTSATGLGSASSMSSGIGIGAGGAGAAGATGSGATGSGTTGSSGTTMGTGTSGSTTTTPQ